MITDQTPDKHRPRRNIAYYYAITLLILILLNALLFPQLMQRQVIEVGYNDFLDMLEAGQVQTVAYEEENYQIVNPRIRLYGLAIQDFPAHSQPIYTTLTPKSTTWSPDNKSQVGPVLPV